MIGVLIPLLTVLAFGTFTGILVFRNFRLEPVILCLIYLIPFLDMKVTPSYLGGFKLYDFFAVICALVFWKEMIFTWGYSITSTLAVLVITLIVISGLSIVLSEFPHDLMIKLVKLSSIFVFTRLFIKCCTQNPNFRSDALKAVRSAVVFALCFLFFQVAFGLDFRLYSQLAENTVDPANEQFRYPGIFYDSQASGQFLALGSFLFLDIRKADLRHAKVTYFVLFILICVATLLAGSRSALGGLIIALTLYSIFKSTQTRVATAVVAIVVVCLSLTGFSSLPKILKRTENLDADYQFRKSLWTEAVSITEKHRLMGIGLGNYQDYIIKHLPHQYLELEDGSYLYFDQPENGYLKILVELGAVGLATCLLLIGLPMMNSVYRYAIGEIDSGVLVHIASIITWLIAFNTVYSIYDYRILIMIAIQCLFMITYPSNHKESCQTLSIKY